jgi:glycosyltransferase involved in cell wall biosynthesis
MTERVRRVSVIVPTRDRSASLQRLLDALDAQTYDDFEVIVVDDGSSEDIAGLVAARAGDLTCVRTTGVGAVRARCAGVAVARGSILAFTDSDCMPDASWIARGVAAIDDGAEVVQGTTIPERPVGAFERSVAHNAGDGLFATCNVFYRREAYDRAGGFDRSAVDRLGFRPDHRARGLGFGEDALLGWAVARKGRVAYLPDAIVRHEVVKTSFLELVSRAWMAGAFPSLIREIPELQRTLLRRRVVLGRADARLCAYGFPLLVLGPLSPFGVVAAASWLISRGRRAFARDGAVRGATSLLLDLVLDVTTCAALVAGSVRARKLVV